MSTSQQQSEKITRPQHRVSLHLVLNYLHAGLHYIVSIIEVYASYLLIVGWHHLMMIQQFLTRIQSRMKMILRAPIRLWSYSKCSPRLIKQGKSPYEPQNSTQERENCVQSFKKRTRNSPKCRIRIRSDSWPISGWNDPKLVLEINRHVLIEISFDCSSFTAKKSPKSQFKIFT